MRGEHIMEDMNNTDFVQVTEDGTTTSETKKKRTYTRRKPVEQSQPDNTTVEMKLFSVYVANGWNRVDGTLIAETEDAAKKSAFKMLKIDEEEQDKVTVLINEIKTGIHLVQ